jgi:hypothetical protein
MSSRISFRSSHIDSDVPSMRTNGPISRACVRPKTGRASTRMSFLNNIFFLQSCSDMSSDQSPSLMPCHECWFIDNNGWSQKAKFRLFCAKSIFLALCPALKCSLIRNSTKKFTFSQTFANYHKTAIKLNLSSYFIWCN